TTIRRTTDATLIAGTTLFAVTAAGGVRHSFPTRRSADRTLTDTDVDDAANTFLTVAAGAASDSHFGTYALTADGTWTYTLDNSNAGGQALNTRGTFTERLTVRTADGNAQQVAINIHRTND